MASLAKWPVPFFTARLQSRPRWLFACLGPLTCFILHWLSFFVLGRKTLTALICAMPSNAQMLASYRQWIPVSSLLGSVVYMLLPFLGVLMLVCVDVLRSEGRNYARLVELACLAFYFLLPFLISMLWLSLVFVPPRPVVGADYSSYDLFEIVRDYRSSVQMTLTINLIRVLELAFQACAAILVVAAYRAFCHCSGSLAFLLTFGLVVLFLTVS